MNFGHASSVTVLCIKLVLFTLEMVRYPVDKAETMEGGKIYFLLVFPASDKTFFTKKKMKS